MLRCVSLVSNERSYFRKDYALTPASLTPTRCVSSLFSSYTTRPSSRLPTCKMTVCDRFPLPIPAARIPSATICRIISAGASMFTPCLWSPRTARNSQVRRNDRAGCKAWKVYRADGRNLQALICGSGCPAAEASAAEKPPPAVLFGTSS